MTDDAQERYHLSAEWVPRILDQAEVTRLLQEAGFVALSTVAQNYDFVYATGHEWWEARWTDAARLPLERMPPAVLEQFKAEVFERLPSMKQADGLHYSRSASSVVGTKPLVDLQ